MIKILYFLCFLLTTHLSFSVNIENVEKPNINESIKPSLPTTIPLIPLVPALPNAVENIDEEGNVRNLEKNFTVMVEAKVNVFIPLEIVSDIDVEATVFDNEIVDVPFEIELNREPEKQNYYKIKYSETNIDIDNDGKVDTYIHSPEFANAKYIKDNFVRIYGENISKEGSYNKKIYLTVEAGI